MFLPAARGFDEYLGIPYSDDMGGARTTPCNDDDDDEEEDTTVEVGRRSLSASAASPFTFDGTGYCEAGFCLQDGEGEVVERENGSDPAGTYLPLVHQTTANGNVTTIVVEQPLDFTTLASKYSTFLTEFIESNKDDPFFLYVPFSHV